MRLTPSKAGTHHYHGEMRLAAGLGASVTFMAGAVVLDLQDGGGEGLR